MPRLRSAALACILALTPLAALTPSAQAHRAHPASHHRARAGHAKAHPRHARGRASRPTPSAGKATAATVTATTTTAVRTTTSASIRPGRAAIAPTATTSTGTAGSVVPFTATGPWNAPLPGGAPVDPNSSAVVSDLVGQVQTPYGEAVLNTSRYSAPIYTVPTGQTTVNVTWTNCLSQASEPPTLVTALQNVPIPANAVPSLGSDADLVIYQPSTDTEWELWRAAQSGSSWSACGAGEIQNVSQNPGIFSTGGITGSGLPMLGYLIRVSELQSGAINHAVDVLLPCTRKSTFSWPAWRTDGSCTDANAPIEGERFRLPASLDLSTLNLSPGELMIARAMQQYGAIVAGTSGRAVIQAEDPRPYETGGAADPYASYFTGTQSDWLKNFPWQDLQGVTLNYGKPSTQTPPSTASSVPFLMSGPWNAPLPSSAPLDPNSGAIAADLDGQVQTPYGEAALNTDRFSAPIYTVAAGQATVNVTWSNCLGTGWESPAVTAALTNVPIPAGAVPSGGSDEEMVVYQPSADTEWEFWRAVQTNGAWSACGAGRIQNVSQAPGIFPTGGVTGSGLPLLGFLIRVSDLQSGAINHAINIELPCVRQAAFSWPAQRTDGACTDPNAPAEGERFRLPASLDLSTLNLSPGELMIARAMQQYGAIVTDYAGRVAIQAEDPRPYEVNGAPNPYAAYFTGQSYDWLKDLPYQDLQAVAWNYGQPGP
jgi:hypothetical protein